MNIVGELRYYLGDDYATLKFSESLESFSIDIVSVPAAHRGTGVGRTLISHVLNLADLRRKNVHLSARPIGSYDEDKLARLVRYYQRFGFEQVDRGVTVVYMVRRPLPGSPPVAPPHQPFTRN